MHPLIQSCVILTMLMCMTPRTFARSTPVVRGWGCIHILAEPGPLRIVVNKIDLDVKGPGEQLVVRLLAPDRQVIEQVVLDDHLDLGVEPDDALNQAVIETHIERAGIYKLDIDPRTGYQSGGTLAWSVDISAKRYMYQSQPSFIAPSQPVDVCFVPQPGAHDLTVTSHGYAQTVTLFDGDRELVATIELAEKGKQTISIEPSASDTNPWRLHFEKQRHAVDIDGVTTFPGTPEDYYPRLPYWTDRTSAWFPVEDVRWMLTPYHHVTYRQPGDWCEVKLDLHNNSDRLVTYHIDVESTDGLDADTLKIVPLEPGETMKLPVTLKVSSDAKPGDELTARVRAAIADAPGYATWSTLFVRVGEAPVSQPVSMPITAEPYQHENLQFGYEPDYVPNGVYFDHQNRPYIRHRTRHRHIVTALETLVNRRWRHSPFIDAIKAVLPNFEQTYFAAHAQPVKTAFDGDDTAYHLIGIRAGGARRVVLLTSADHLDSYEVYDVAGASDISYDIEQFSGHNDDRGGPPPMLIYRKRAEHESRWADYWDLLLYLPTRDASGKLALGEPIVVSDRCVGLAGHSGGAGAVASVGSKVHIVWGETVDDPETVDGVPTYVATYDRSTGELAEKVLLSYGSPVNDVHNSPGIVVDSKGFLHVVSGAHGQPFMYNRSLAPNDAYSGWTEAEPVLTKGRINSNTDADGDGGQTYLGLICDKDDTLHIAYRQWRENVDERFGGRLYAALSHQSKQPGEPWSEARPLFVPPLPDYSVFYHKLSVDRIGRIFLQYSYYSVHQHYRTDLPGLLDYQTIIMSADNGQTWKLVETRDFLVGMTGR